MFLLGCQPPADTKIEFNFPPQPPTSDSWYDISLVEGYSLAMSITPRGVNQGSCVPTQCRLSWIGRFEVRQERENGRLPCALQKMVGP